MIIVCPECGANNRLPDTTEPSKKYRCAKCNTRLPNVSEIPATRYERTAPHVHTGGRKIATRVVGTALRQFPVVHPLLFAMFPILFLYSENIAEVSPSEIVMPMALALGSTLLLLVLSGLILRDFRKAGIVVSILLFLFFSYGNIFLLMGEWDSVHNLLLPIWVILFLCTAYFVIKTRRDLHKVSNILNMVAAVIVLFFAINITANETDIALQDIETAVGTETDTVNLGEAKIDTLPDIYYIILDRYPSARTLEEVYDFDNSEFMDYLSTKGFYIASESMANYPNTRSSLASALNMEYVNYLSEVLGEEFSDVGVIDAMLEDYKVWRLLKSRGYEFIHFGDWWEMTRENTHADVNINYYNIPEFSLRLFISTWLYPISVKLHVFEDWHYMQWKRVLYKFDKLAEIPNIEEPTFVFAHFITPHPPYVFDMEGNYVSADEVRRRDEMINYLDQLVYINSKVRALIDEILSISEVPPIIILQSDEGTWPERMRVDSSNFSYEVATDAELREKMNILNAYYLPDIDKDVLYPSITPINTFRLVFNSYFDADLELLPDRSYAFYKGHPFKFFDITDKVKYD